MAALVIGLAIGLTAQVPQPLALTGRVIDASGGAVSGAEVRASDEGAGLLVSGRTDAGGQFTIALRQPGRFAITATAAGFLPGEFGALAPGQPGVPVRIDNGRRPGDLSIVLLRPGAIHGRVLDAAGRPAAAAVHALTSRWNGSRFVLTRAAMASTDAGGQYTLGELPPDDYVVLAVPAGEAAFAPMFHPGAAGPASAARVVVGAGGAVHGVDITVGAEPATDVTVRLRGGRALVYPSVVVIPDETGDVALQADTSPVDRPLVVGRLTAGRYAVIGTALEPDESSGTLERRWATQTVDVDGRQPVDLALDLAPGASIDGRVVVDASAPASIELPDHWLWPWDDDRPLGLLPFTGVRTAGAGGTFSIDGIAPGRYVVQFGRDGRAQPPGWSIAAVRFGGQDVVDLPVELYAGERHVDVEIVVTAQQTEIAGTLVGADGQPRSDVTLVAFAVDSRYWWTGTRRIRLARPDTAGYYRMRGLPAGDYFLVAVSGAIPAEPADPRWLGSLTAAALTLQITPGGRVVQDIRTPGVF